MTSPVEPKLGDGVRAEDGADFDDRSSEEWDDIGAGVAFEGASDDVRGVEDELDGTIGSEGEYDMKEAVSALSEPLETELGDNYIEDALSAMEEDGDFRSSWKTAQSTPKHMARSGEPGRHLRREPRHLKPGAEWDEDVQMGKHLNRSGVSEFINEKVPVVEIEDLEPHEKARYIDRRVPKVDVEYNLRDRVNPRRLDESISAKSKDSEELTAPRTIEEVPEAPVAVAQEAEAAQEAEPVVEVSMSEADMRTSGVVAGESYDESTEPVVENPSSLGAEPAVGEPHVDSVELGDASRAVEPAMDAGLAVDTLEPGGEITKTDLEGAADSKKSIVSWRKQIPDERKKALKNKRIKYEDMDQVQRGDMSIVQESTEYAIYCGKLDKLYVGLESESRKLSGIKMDLKNIGWRPQNLGRRMGLWRRQKEARMMKKRIKKSVKALAKEYPVEANVFRLYVEGKSPEQFARRVVRNLSNPQSADEYTPTMSKIPEDARRESEEGAFRFAAGVRDRLDGKTQ